MTKFHIKKTFPISGRQSIVFEGEIVSGTVNAGQKIKLITSDSHPLIELTISSVEFVDHSAGKIANIGLIVRIDSADDLNDLLSYKIQNEKCEIV